LTKISDDPIRTPDPVLKETLSTIITLWNLGKVSFNLVTTVPTDTPDDPEIRVFLSGSTRRLYVFIPGDVWTYVDLTV
jgi:hypothetical protein